MADFDANFRYDSDFSKVTEDIKNLVREATNANSVFAQLNKTAASVKMEAARSFSAQAGFAGFKAQIVDLTGATEQFGQQLMKNKLTMKEYFSEAAKAYKKDSKARALAEREVRRAQSTVVGMGDINGRRKGMLVTPEALDMSKAGVKLQVANKQYEIFNDLVQKGSTAMINWGKNTQWAGRQLTVGLTVPMTIFTSQALKAFAALDEEVTRFTKVYGSDLMGAVDNSTQEMVNQIKGLGSEFAKQYGIASSQTMALAADLAAAGLEGEKLANAVNQTTRMMVLGEVDRQEAMKATLSIQTAFNQSSKELAQSIDFLNAVENTTSASLQDLTEAIPKAGPVIQALGGDIKDLSVLMTALREGGINAAEGANAIKSGMASLISPTKQAIGVAKQFGIDLEAIVKNNRGQLMPLLIDFQQQLKGLDDFGKAQVIEQIFGKYQFARISALFDNLNAQGSQTVGMMKLMKMSADDLAKKSYSELKAQENAPSTRLAAMQQQLQENLIQVGADLAETLLPIMQGALDILQKIVDGFNNLPGPIKSFAKIIGGIVTAAGPILMLGGIFGNLIGNAIKFGMSIVNLFKKLTGHPVRQLQILSDEELAAKLAADQLTGAYERQRTSVAELNAALDLYIANLRTAASIAPPGAVMPGKGRGPIRRATGGVIYAKDGVDSGGRINGYGGGDTVPALLEPGEFVINKQSSAKYAPLLRDINQGKDVPGYTKGLTDGKKNPVTSHNESIIDQTPSMSISGSQKAEYSASNVTSSLVGEIMSLPDADPRKKAFMSYYVGTDDVLSKFSDAKYGNLLDNELTKKISEVGGLSNIERAKRIDALFNSILDEKVSALATSKGISPSNLLPQEINALKAEAMATSIRSVSGYAIMDRSHFGEFATPVTFEDSNGKKWWTPKKAYAATAGLEPKAFNHLIQILGERELTKVNSVQQLKLPQTEKEIAQSNKIIDRLLNPQSKFTKAELKSLRVSDLTKYLSKLSGTNFSEAEIAKISQLMSGTGAPVSAADRLVFEKWFSAIDIGLQDPRGREVISEIFKSGTGSKSPLAKVLTSIVYTKKIGDSVRAGTYNEVISSQMKESLLSTIGSSKYSKISQESFGEIESIAKELAKNGVTEATLDRMSKLSTTVAGGDITLAGKALEEWRAQAIANDEYMARKSVKGISYKIDKAKVKTYSPTEFFKKFRRYAGGFTGFRGFGQGRPGQYSGPSWMNPRNPIRRPGSKEAFRFEGQQIEGALGKSTKGELSGVYKLGNDKFYVKTFNDELSVLAEVSANRILKKMFPELAIPESRIGKVGKSNELAAISPMMRTLTQEQMGAGKLSEQGVVDAMLAQSLAGGRDLSPGNLMGEGFGGSAFTKVAHVDPSEAFIKKLASGSPAMSPAELTDPAQRALANFGAIKGGARRYGRDTLAGMGISSGRLEVMMRRSLAKASSVSQEQLMSEVKRGLQGMPKKTRRAADAWATQMGHASFEEAITSIAMQRIQKVADVIPQLAAATGSKSTGRSIVSGLSIRTSAQEKARQDAIRAHIGENRIGELASDRFKPLVSNELIGNPYAEAIMNASPLRARRVIPEIANMQRIQPHDRMVYRGTQLSEEELAAIRSGLPFDLSKNILTPTSTNQAVAEHMANIGGAGEKLSGTKAVFRIKTNAGMVEVPFQDILGGKPVWLKDLGGFNEAEIAYAKMQARLLGEQKIGDTIYFDVEALQNQALFPELMRSSLQKSEIVKMATGGQLPGYGGGDKIPALLEPGEFVINKQASAQYAPILKGINDGTVGKFSVGKIGERIAAHGGKAAVGMQAGFGIMSLMALPSIIGDMKESGINFTNAMEAAMQTFFLISSAKTIGGVLGFTKAAGQSGKMLGTLTSGFGQVASKLGMTAMGLGGLTLAIGAAVVAYQLWQNHLEDLKRSAAAPFKEATEMAKVYNIELKKNTAALKQNSEQARSLGMGNAIKGRGQVEKDYAKAVSKDYGDLVTRIKDAANAQLKVNDLTSVYSSLITQGFSIKQAKEITAEIARQAGATGELSIAMNGMAGNIKTAADAMDVMVTSAITEIQMLGTTEEKVAALNEAYNNLVRQAADNPVQFSISSKELISNTLQNDVAAGRQMLEQQLLNAGYGEGSKPRSVLDKLDLTSEDGKKRAELMMQGIAAGMDVSKLDLPTIELEGYVNKLTVAEQAKVDLNKQMDALIEAEKKNIDATNKWANDAIDRINAEKDALQKAHEKRMKNLEAEAKALQDRADLIRDNTDFYIAQLEKEYATEQYYQNQRKTAASGLEALSKGDMFGYLQAQMQSASDAEQFGREQAIKQIEDTRDAALKSIDGALKLNQDAQANADDAFNKAMDDADNRIEAINKKRSKIIKGFQDIIDAAQKVKDAKVGEVTTEQLQNIENAGAQVAKIVPKFMKEGVTSASNMIVENFGTAIGDATKKIATDSNLTTEESAKLLSSVLGIFTVTQASKKNPASNPRQADWQDNRDANVGAGAGDLTNAANTGYQNSNGQGSNVGGDAGANNSYFYSVPYTDGYGVTYYTLYKKTGKKGKWKLFSSANQETPYLKNLPHKAFNMGGKVLKYNSGTSRMVPGFGNSDTVNAMLTPGEFVSDATATRRNLPVLQAMNAGATFTVPQLRSYNGTMGAENETYNSNVNMPVNITINGSNLTIDQIKNDIYGELVKAKNMVVNSIGEYR